MQWNAKHTNKYNNSTKNTDWCQLAIKICFLFNWTTKKKGQMIQHIFHKHNSFWVKPVHHISLTDHMNHKHILDLAWHYFWPVITDDGGKTFHFCSCDRTSSNNRFKVMPCFSWNDVWCHCYHAEDANFKYLNWYFTELVVENWPKMGVLKFGLVIFIAESMNQLY